MLTAVPPVGESYAAVHDAHVRSYGQNYGFLACIYLLFLFREMINLFSHSVIEKSVFTISYKVWKFLTKCGSFLQNVAIDNNKQEIAYNISNCLQSEIVYGFFWTTMM